MGIENNQGRGSLRQRRNRLVSSHCGSKFPEALSGDFFPYLLNLVKADLHFVMNLVDGTTADGIMRVAFH